MNVESDETLETIGGRGHVERVARGVWQRRGGALRGARVAHHAVLVPVDLVYRVAGDAAFEAELLADVHEALTSGKFHRRQN